MLLSELERAIRAQAGDEGGIGPAAQALMEVTEVRIGQGGMQSKGPLDEHLYNLHHH